jgi:RimJ/RimL family protein N-acetyltransferase
MMPWPVAIYLRDDRYGLRAPVPDDADVAGAWYEGAFPVSAEAARAMLVEQESIPWGGNPTIRLIVTELETGAVVGGALVERQNTRVGKLQVTVGGPDRAGEGAQRLRAAVLRLLVPWVMGELNMMTAVLDVPADETIVIDAARELGLVEVARLREHIARSAGRVDLLMLERVNRQWGRGDA